MKKLLNLIVIIGLCLLLCGCKKQDYDNAFDAYEAGNYEEASVLFGELGDYKDSEYYYIDSIYCMAENSFHMGEYEAAISYYSQIENYKNADSMLEESKRLLKLQTDYTKASKLYEERKYEAAAALYDALGDYMDSSVLYEECMYHQNPEVYDALHAEYWYSNGGSNAELARWSFDGMKATRETVYFDGNRKHDGTKKSFTFTVSKKAIHIEGAEDIAYRVESGRLILSDTGFYTISEIEDAIQGYWKVTKSFLGYKSEHNLHISNGTMTYEHASESLYGGDYFYYGPYQGNYKLNFGGFQSPMMHSGDWFFNIIGGEPVVLNFDSVCVRTDRFPGEHGYRF